MAEERLRGKIKGGRRPARASRSQGDAADNLLKLCFPLDGAPASVGDIAYVATREG